MARKTVRVDIPKRYPDKFTKLLEDVWEMHVELGASSPLHNHTVLNMATFEAKKTQALALRAEALELHAKAQSKMQQSRKLLGTDAGQTIYSEGTLYYMLDIIRRILLTNHMG